ncbi:hypothetical protein [Amycolatopsis sp. NPDC058986]|uniref:hypothetical protein n=1 Tax=unclassified Amycolatopsis TaxID=2618356 RepID=UPI00367048E9
MAPVDDLAEFDRVVREHDAGPGDDLGFLAKFEPVDDLIAAGLRKTLDDHDWYAFQTYLFLAGSRPSAKYVDTLNEVLDRRLADYAPEDVVSYLGDIRDPKAVPSLERALSWRREDDEFHQFAFKVLSALMAIGGEESWRVIESARHDDRDRVRDIADQLSGKRGNG